VHPVDRPLRKQPTGVRARAQARQGAAELAALQRARDMQAAAGRPAAPAPDNVLGHWVQRSEASRLTARPAARSRMFAVAAGAVT